MALQANSLFSWVYAIHVFAVAPLLLFVGINGYDTPRWAFELLAMFGFSAIGYHLYRIVVQIQEASI